MQKSESIAKLAQALEAATAEFKPLHKDAENPFHKSRYTTLGTVLESVKEGLMNNGLSLLQVGAPLVPGLVGIKTILMHNSGEWLAGDQYVQPVKNDPQGAGSAITYLRRYGICCLLSLFADSDDDANMATHAQPAPAPQPQQPRYENLPNMAPGPAKGPSEAQIKRAYAIAKQGGYDRNDIMQFIKDTWDLDHLSNLSRQQYDALCTMLSKPKLTTQQQAGDVTDDGFPF